MISDDKKEFAKLMYGLAEIYERKMTKNQLVLYFASLSEYELNKVNSAINAHVKDPDCGTFMPKPADIIKQITGTAKDLKLAIESNALMQWSCVIAAIRGVGSYQTPNFKDAITSAVVSTMNWVELCSMTTEQLKWAEKSFVRTYQDYSTLPIERLPSHIAGRENIQDHKNQSAAELKTIVTNIEALEISKNEQSS